MKHTHFRLFLALFLLLFLAATPVQAMVSKDPPDIAALDFGYFEAGGQLRVFFPMEEGTFCQVSASLFRDTFIYNVGIGLTEEWPAVGGIIDGLKGE